MDWNGPEQEKMRGTETDVLGLPGLWKDIGFYAEVRGAITGFWGRGPTYSKLHLKRLTRARVEAGRPAWQEPRQ